MNPRRRGRSHIQFEPHSPPRTQGLPEFFEFRDTGCDLHPACLSCPFERCRYDAKIDVVRAAQRRTEAKRLRASGLKAPAIAAMMGVTERTVFRALARVRT